MKVHIGEAIKKRAEELKVGTTELGRLINTSKQNIYGIFKRSTIDTHLLFEISKALKFNFFQYFESSQLPLSENKLQKELDSVQKENEKLKTDINGLKEKNELLQKINTLLEAKKKKS